MWCRVDLVRNNDFRSSAAPMCEPATDADGYERWKKDQNYNQKHVSCGHAVVRGALYRQIPDLKRRCSYGLSSGSSVPIFERGPHGSGCPPNACGIELN
jgi:hypothetical protein